MKIERCTPLPCRPSSETLSWDDILGKPGIYSVVGRSHLRIVIVDHKNAIFINSGTELYVVEKDQFIGDTFCHIPGAKLYAEIRE